MFVQRQSNVPSSDLLDEICVRFILTLPATELESFERLLFSVEQAWWHYEVCSFQACFTCCLSLIISPRPHHPFPFSPPLPQPFASQDNVRLKHPELRSYTLKEFTSLIFEKCPGLEPFKGSLNEIYEAFNAYKRTIPVRGAILLDPTMKKVLLVRGYKKDAGWGFPRGKLSKDETDDQCAAREVLEETGLDIADKVDPSQFIDVQLGAQATRLFIVQVSQIHFLYIVVNYGTNLRVFMSARLQDVDDQTAFAPHVKGEIGAFAWHLISNLPSSFEESKQSYVTNTGEKYKFYNVWPYMKPLQAWINRRRKGGGGKRGGVAASSSGNAWLNFNFDKKELMKFFRFDD